MRRRTFLQGAALAAGGSIIGCPDGWATPSAVRIGIMAPSHCALPVAYAGARRQFAKDGIRAELVYFDSMPEIVRGLHLGELQFGQLTTPLALALGAGNPKFPPMKVAAAQVLGINGGVLAVSAKSNIATLQDLKGKQIGVHSPYMIHSVILNMLMEKSGLDPSKDLEVTIVPMKDMGSALKEGTVDAVIGPEPLPTLLQHKGLSKTLLITRMFWHNHPCCLLACPVDTFDKSPEMVEQVTLACMTAGLELDGVVTRPDAIAETHAAYPKYGQVPLEQLLSAFQSRRSDFYPFPYQSAGLLVAQQMKSNGLLPPEIDEKQLVADVFRSDLALEFVAAAAGRVPGAVAPMSAYREESLEVIGT